ncbi:NDUF B12 domain containing protein [Asbolus verrucosus]|uniref:NADH dehydrogenase [ubiquinone] 1 beta subcomplex subunit 3 n=1 Tax=Asbolus verrucosus TaxID=1661398 RepID=A0A482VH96_ASBVE|nr:NDUF B12 domain containing protein [Asbolus verrucosus]
MGGGHHEPYKVPDYRIYKVEDIPQLATTQRALAAQGLKDPWLRNEVWRYDPKIWGTEKTRVRGFFLRGFKTGFAAFLVTIAATAVYDKMHPSEHGHHDH